MCELSPSGLALMCSWKLDLTLPQSLRNIGQAPHGPTSGGPHVPEKDISKL